jgi:ATP-dependent DNA ligase
MGGALRRSLLRAVGSCRGRSGRDLTPYFGDVAAAVARSLPPGTVVDGEPVIWDGGRFDFEALGRCVIGRGRLRLPAYLVVFDLLQHGDLLHLRRD